MKVKHIYILLLVLSFGIESCVKKNLKAIDDNNKVYDPDISLNKIFYSVSSNNQREVYEINPDGSEKINITNTPYRNEDYPSVSHDAKRIAYTSGDRLFQSAIDGSDEVEITNNSIFSTREFTPTFLSWSDKSNFITFNNTKDTTNHYVDSQYDTKIKKSITSSFKNDQGYVSTYINFSPVEDKVVFVNRHYVNPFIGISVNWSSLEIANLKGENDSSAVIISPEGVITKLSFFKDGESLLYQFGNSISMIDVTSENNINLVNQGSGEEISGFSASPDGTQIVYSSNISGNYELYILTIDSKEVTQLTNTVEDELHPFWN